MPGNWLLTDRTVKGSIVISLYLGFPHVLYIFTPMGLNTSDPFSSSLFVTWHQSLGFRSSSPPSLRCAPPGRGSISFPLPGAACRFFFLPSSVAAADLQQQQQSFVCGSPPASSCGGCVYRSAGCLLRVASAAVDVLLLFPAGYFPSPLLISSLRISHILCCSFVLLIWERTEEGIICHPCYCFALMWPLISVAVVQASCFLVLPLMVVRLQYAPISCLGCAVIFK